MEPRFGSGHQRVRGSPVAEVMEPFHKGPHIAGGFVGTHGVGERRGKVEKRSDHARKLERGGMGGYFHLPIQLRIAPKGCAMAPVS
ncbi:hypothetical protein MASR1M101_17720 [Gemmatimonas sp.]